MRFIDQWRPPHMNARLQRPKVGDVIGYKFSAWEVTHIAERPEPDAKGRDMVGTLHLIHGPGTATTNDRGDMAIAFSKHWFVGVYRDGRVWLCSCCGHPAPCRLTVAEETSKQVADEFEKRLARMGPGLCYGCGEVITQRQASMRFPGEHADFPGRSAPAFHLRQKCAGERFAYAERANLHPDGGYLPPPCKGTFIRHGDGTYECPGEDCHGPRARHYSFLICTYAGCTDLNCAGIKSCTPDGTEIRRGADFHATTTQEDR